MMRTSAKTIGVVVAMGLLSFSAPVLAKHAGGGDFHSGGGVAGGVPHGFEQGDKTGWHGSSTPPGWSKGEKKGWHGEKMPPGRFSKGEPVRKDGGK